MKPVLCWMDKAWVVVMFLVSIYPFWLFIFNPETWAYVPKDYKKGSSIIIITSSTKLCNLQWRPFVFKMLIWGWFLIWSNRTSKESLKSKGDKALMYCISSLLASILVCWVSRSIQQCVMYGDRIPCTLVEFR